MALEMTGEYVLPLPSDAVWSALNDPEFLQRCIPGCESFEKLSDTEFVAIVWLSIGPVKARFKGGVKLQDLNPPQSYTIVGQGEGGIAGFAKGNAAVTLTNIAEGTNLSYRAQAQIGGKIAQLGQRLVAGTAKRITDLFFANCVAALSQNQGSLDVKQSTDVG
jgi:carbon monoxide dehydrogenase subunit G